MNLIKEELSSSSLSSIKEEEEESSSLKKKESSKKKELSKENSEESIKENSEELTKEKKESLSKEDRQQLSLIQNNFAQYLSKEEKGNSKQKVKYLACDCYSDEQLFILFNNVETSLSRLEEIQEKKCICCYNKELKCSLYSIHEDNHWMCFNCLEIHQGKTIKIKRAKYKNISVWKVGKYKSQFQEELKFNSLKSDEERIDYYRQLNVQKEKEEKKVIRLKEKENKTREEKIQEEKKRKIKENEEYQQEMKRKVEEIKELMNKQKIQKELIKIQN